MTKPESSNSSIEFENVYFRYPDKKDYAVERVSFQIKGGSRVAILGKSGSGKSTIFVKLLSGLYDIEEGKIKIGGRKVKSEEATKHVSIVPQFVSILHGRTVFENLAFNGESIEKVRKICAALDMDEVFMALPQGYDTVLEGDQLSGGQIQRLGIARALLKEASIVIIDEGTSNQDKQNESRIKTIISHLRPEQTVIMIAHSSSAIEGLVKRILVFDNGKLVKDLDVQEFEGIDKILKDS